jgi:hypothetical protein
VRPYAPHEGMGVVRGIDERLWANDGLGTPVSGTGARGSGEPGTGVLASGVLWSVDLTTGVPMICGSVTSAPGIFALASGHAASRREVQWWCPPSL